MVLPCSTSAFGSFTFLFEFLHWFYSLGNCLEFVSIIEHFLYFDITEPYLNFGAKRIDGTQLGEESRV